MRFFIKEIAQALSSIKGLQRVQKKALESLGYPSSVTISAALNLSQLLGLCPEPPVRLEGTMCES